MCLTKLLRRDKIKFMSIEDKRQDKELKLNFELVPDSCWYGNLRTYFKPQVWDIIRRKAYSKADGKCTICNAPTKRLEAHEQWEYDEENKVQRLKRVIAICPDCHKVIHIGLTQLKGNEQAAIEHFIKVNNSTYADYRKALGKANADHARRNRVDEWALDLTWLKEFLEIE